ncbi:unnamed protein product, partial [marine sediment metagenome]
MKKKSFVAPKETDQPPLVDLALYDVPPLKRKSPKWILEEPIASVGSWEPLWHRRRCASWNAVEDGDGFAYEHSEAFVKDLKAVGCRMLISSFSKNHYIDDDEMPLKKK